MDYVFFYEEFWPMLLTRLARDDRQKVGVRRLAMMGAAFARTPERFSRRVRVLSRTDPPKLTTQPLGSLGPIWMFWAQGLDEAPPIVRRSVDSIKSFANGRDVIVLDHRSAGDYLGRVPSAYKGLNHYTSWAHFSDALRLALIAEHGGTWFDATILQVAPMPPDIMDADLTLPATPRITRLVGNWFIHGRAHHPLIEAWLEQLIAYRAVTRPRTRPYMHMHYLMEAMTLYDAGCAAMLERAATMDANPSLAIVRTAKRKGDDTPWDDLATKSWMHKLTYKPPGAAPIRKWLDERRPIVSA